MGLIRAGLAALSSTINDQWKEYFYCDALDNDTLIVKGQKDTRFLSANKGQDNIITNGSGIVVADGQCMIIVDDGEIVEVCAEPGKFTYDSSSEPSIFTGSFGEALKQTFKTIAKRFTYGGDAGKDQRVYYINTKEIFDNKFGTPNPISFRCVDSSINFDLDVTLKCSGTYTFKIIDPVLFYSSVAGNVSNAFRKEEIYDELRSEFISALNPSIASLSKLELRPSQLPEHTAELEAALNEFLSEKWGALRGIEVVNVAINNVTIPLEDQERLKDAQAVKMYQNKSYADAATIQANVQAVKDAANNAGGAINGFVNLNAANNASANAATVLNQMNQTPVTPAADSWTCGCGAVNTGNFCPNCGAKKPEATWTCVCGTVCTANFCPTCGTKKPQ